VAQPTPPVGEQHSYLSNAPHSLNKLLMNAESDGSTMLDVISLYLSIIAESFIRYPILGIS